MKALNAIVVAAMLVMGAGAAMATATFRMMDPASHRMIGVRADMTPQIARIAATRLGDAPRPLRLSYAGQVLRVSGSEIRPERQIGQVGAELIGAAGPAADVEAIAVAGEALVAIGVPELSVDITLPTLVPAVAEAYGIAFIAPLGVSTEIEPSARDIAGIIGQVKQAKIPAVFLENMSDDRLIGRIAVESGAKLGGTLYSDALTGEKGDAPTYIAMVRHNIKALTSALSQ